MLQRVLHKLANVVQHCLNASQISVAHRAGLCIVVQVSMLEGYGALEIADCELEYRQLWTWQEPRLAPNTLQPYTLKLLVHVQGRYMDA